MNMTESETSYIV